MAKAKSAKSKKTAAKRGAPTKYIPEYHPDKAFELCVDFGATDKQLAKHLEIAESTLNNWKKDHPEFMESIKNAKDIFDTKTVEDCLLKRARGFRYTETTREPAAVADSKTGKSKMIITKKVSKLVIPDVGAQCFWLKNRHPDRWKDIKQSVLTGENGGPVNVNIIDKYPGTDDSA